MSLRMIYFGRFYAKKRKQTTAAMVNNQLLNDIEIVLPLDEAIPEFPILPGHLHLYSLVMKITMIKISPIKNL